MSILCSKVKRLSFITSFTFALILFVAFWLGVEMNLPLGLTAKFHPRKSNLSVLCTTLVLASLTFSPLISKKLSICLRRISGSSSGFKKNTTSSAYRNPLIVSICLWLIFLYLTSSPTFSSPCRTIFASNGLMTPPWGVPDSDEANSPRTQALIARNSPFFAAFGSWTDCIKNLWSILSKHFSISNYRILLLIPLAFPPLRLLNTCLWTS